MSKKKNTLKDLDEFLKQQAATLVSPARLSEKTEAPQPPADPASTPAGEERSAPLVQATQTERTISRSSLVKDLKQLATIHGTSLNEEFCDLLLASVEGQQEFSAEDKMLINTALYLKHGAAWKEAIRAFWQNKKS
ncbi:MAG TPA: hypothetical protein VGD65_04875 [Chryseosolibacter sp.]